jgi:hypothetical protein
MRVGLGRWVDYGVEGDAECTGRRRTYYQV